MLYNGCKFHDFPKIDDVSISTWSQHPMKKNDRKLWWAAPLGICWVIRKERNRIVFEDVHFS